EKESCGEIVKKVSDAGFGVSQFRSSPKYADQSQSAQKQYPGQCYPLLKTGDIRQHGGSVDGEKDEYGIADDDSGHDFQGIPESVVNTGLDQGKKYGAERRAK